MILRRTDEGASKCALRDLRREEWMSGGGQVGRESGREAEEEESMKGEGGMGSARRKVLHAKASVPFLCVLWLCLSRACIRRKRRAMRRASRSVQKGEQQPG